MDENRQELMEIGADDFIGKPFREAELFQKIHAHVGVEYVYAEDPAAAGPEEAAGLTPESLAGWPRRASSTRCARPSSRRTWTSCWRKSRRPRPATRASARGLRRLAEGFQYQKLLDLFAPEPP